MKKREEFNKIKAQGKAALKNAAKQKSKKKKLRHQISAAPTQECEQENIITEVKKS